MPNLYEHQGGGSFKRVTNAYEHQGGGSFKRLLQGWEYQGSGVWKLMYAAFTERTDEYNLGNTGLGFHTLTIPVGCTGLWLTVYQNGDTGQGPQQMDSEVWGGDGGAGGARVQHRISIGPSDWGKTISYRIGSPSDFEGTNVNSTGQGLSAGDFNISGSGGNYENLPNQPGTAADHFDGSPGGFGGPGYDDLNPGGGGAEGGNIFNQPTAGAPGILFFNWKAP